MTVRTGGATATGPPLVSVQGAYRAFAARTPLAGVDLEVRSGEILALLGPNGAGKTSLMHALTGRWRLDRGTVRILGADPLRNPRARRQLGFVPQEVALYPFLTAIENLEVLGRLAGLGTRELRERVPRVLHWIGLESRAREPVERLSGGMRRRVHIAAGVLHEPALLLLDEPTVGVDPEARERVHDLLRDLRGKGLGVVFATHDLHEAEALSDRIAIMVAGQVRACDSLPGLVREHFGSVEELRVTLDHEVREDEAAPLLERGLIRESPLRYAGPWAEGLDDLPRAAAAWRAAGLKISEVALRAPGLRSVYSRVTGQEVES